MGYLLAFAFSCICGWYWIKGTAFMAYVTAVAWVALVVVTGSLTGHVSDLYRMAFGIAIACAPWFIRQAVRDARLPYWQNKRHAVHAMFTKRLLPHH